MGHVTEGTSVIDTPATAEAAQTFDDLYRSARGELYGALASITDDQDLATEAIDVGFTRWRRKLRKPPSVAAEVGVMALAYRFARKQLHKSSRQLSGFRLGGQSEPPDAKAMGRFRALSLDERALLVMSDHLGWSDGEISHAIGADGAGAASRALSERLAGEGFNHTDMTAALEAHVATFSEPLSRLDTVKSKGTLQKIGAFAGGAAVSVAAVAGAVAVIGNLSSSTPGVPDSGGTAVPVEAGTALTAENAVWQRVSPPIASDNIMALAHDGTDFFMLAGDNRGRPVMMQSDNGLDWVQIPGPAVGQNMWFQQILATPDVLLAIGNGFDEVAGRESIAVFTSFEEGTWSRADLPVEDQIEVAGQVFNLHTWVSGASVTDNGFTVMGSQGAEFDPEEMLREVVDASLLRNGWSTTGDGMQFFDNQGNIVESKTWEELGLAPELGALMGGGRPIVWTSSDGVEWEAAAASLPPNTQGIGGFASAGGVEAVMAYGNFGASVWIKDGHEWRRADIDASLSAMTTWNGRILAAGTDAATGTPGIWSTADGATWERSDIPVSGIQQFFSSTDGVVAIGWGDQIGLLGPARIPVGDMTVLATSDGRFVVTDAEGETIIETFQEDIGVGDKIVIADEDTGEVIAEFDRTALDKAWEAIYRDAEFQGNAGPPSISLLISQDGENWTVLQPQDANFYPQSVAFGNNSALMVGWSEGENLFGFGGGGQQLLLVQASG